MAVQVLDTGEEVRLQRNALAVVSVPKGDETVRGGWTEHLLRVF